MSKQMIALAPQTISARVEGKRETESRKRRLASTARSHVQRHSPACSIFDGKIRRGDKRQPYTKKAEREMSDRCLSIMRSLFAAVAVGLSALLAHAAEVKPAPFDTPKRESEVTGVQVRLISDGRTWVSITKVQQPAQFQQKTVTLPPGDYEIVGRRKGYRDVENVLRVRSGEQPTLTIICTVSADSRAP